MTAVNASPAANPTTENSAKAEVKSAPAAPASNSAVKDQVSERRVSFLLEGKLVETVVNPSGLFSFWIQGRNKTELSIKHGDTLFEPHYGLREFWAKKVVRFPSAATSYGTTAGLLEEMAQFIRRYADVPEDWLDIICLYVLMTWVYDRFTAVPYLRFLGEPGTGKTRLLQVSSAISYKGTTVSGNITGPALFRTIDLIQGTMAVDEADFKNSSEWSEITKVLNNGYTEGTPVIRCNKNTFDPECFHVFGPKIISTRNRFEDEATETRCLTFETSDRKVPAHIPFQMPIIFDQEALTLRNKLLQWRCDNFQRVTAKEEGLRDLFARTAQIGASLAAVAPDEQWMAKLVRFLGRMEDSRNEESPKGMVQRALQAFSAGTRTTATVGEVAESVNSERKAMGVDPLTDRRVGGILRSLGFAPKRTNRGYVVPLTPSVNVASERVNVSPG
jgi:hypothetical protein